MYLRAAGLKIKIKRIKNKEFTARNVTESKPAKCQIEPQNNCIEGIYSQTKSSVPPKILLMN